LFFEGSEKKVEVIIKDVGFSLLTDVPNEFWRALVNKANANILSSIENDVCKAFLLSESSLFVWNNRFIVLTCGVTHLVNAVEYFIQKQGKELIEHLTYQRKNEYYSHAQPSCFGDDVKVLSQFVQGNALRFGEMDSHHTFLFHNERVNHHQHKSYELLTYQICESVSHKLTNPTISTTDIRAFLQLDILFPGFTIDDHVFTPYGYSVNGIKNDQYFTIHITPQAESSYISFESNINLIKLAPFILNILKPKSFDLLSFNDNEFELLIEQNVDKKYVSKSLVKQSLTNGNLVLFANYVLPQNEFTAATEFNLFEPHHEL